MDKTIILLNLKENTNILTDLTKHYVTDETVGVYSKVTNEELNFIKTLLSNHFVNTKFFCLQVFGRRYNRRNCFIRNM